MTTIGQIMTTKLISVAPDATVAEAATVMGERHVGSALVMEEGQLIGIFTERDIVRALSQHFDAPGHLVSHWMTRDPSTVEPRATVQEALELMLANGFRHLPVTEGGSVVGMVSIRDLSEALAEQAEESEDSED
jgi:CBS domain-containing protein